jgi:hypothetical protein
VLGVKSDDCGGQTKVKSLRKGESDSMAMGGRVSATIRDDRATSSPLSLELEQLVFINMHVI